jgi:hypothetical protein
MSAGDNDFWERKNLNEKEKAGAHAKFQNPTTTLLGD